MNRGLTTEQAQAGVQPTPLTREEWRAMHMTSVVAAYEALFRTGLLLRIRVDRGERVEISA